MRSAIDEALETNHNRFDGSEKKPKGGKLPPEQEVPETFPLMTVVTPVTRLANGGDPDEVEDAKQDYEYARQISLNLLKQQQAMIESMGNFLNACPSARAYEVMNNMMKTTMDMSRELMELPKKLREAQGVMTETEAKTATPVAGNTYVFSGGPSEVMAKLLEQSTKDKNAIEHQPG